MKKKNIIIGLTCLVAVITVACGTSEKEDGQSNIQAIEKSNDNNTDTIEAFDYKKYEEYEKYGLKYNKEQKIFSTTIIIQNLTA